MKKNMVSSKKIAMQETILKVALLNLSIKSKPQRKIKNPRGKIRSRYNYLIKNKNFSKSTLKLSCQKKKLSLNLNIFQI